MANKVMTHHIKYSQSKTVYSIWVEWTNSASLQKTWSYYTKRTSSLTLRQNKSNFVTKKFSDDRNGWHQNPMWVSNCFHNNKSIKHIGKEWVLPQYSYKCVLRDCTFTRADVCRCTTARIVKTTVECTLFTEYILCSDKTHFISFENT